MTRELIEAAKAVLDLLDPNDCELLRSGARIGEWIRATDALRAAVRAAEAAPVADTVVVPVASLKQWLKRINLMPFRNELQPTIAAITALLPPPPVPSRAQVWSKNGKPLRVRRVTRHTTPSSPPCAPRGKLRRGVRDGR